MNAVTTADMLEIAASGANGAEYVDVTALMERAARDLRMAEGRIDGLRAQLTTVLDREAATAARHDAALEAAEARIAECDPYLKDGETPRQRMDRDVRENQALLKLLAEARARAEAAEAEVARLEAENDRWHRRWADARADAIAAEARAEAAEAALRYVRDEAGTLTQARDRATAALKEAKP